MYKTHRIYDINQYKYIQSIINYSYFALDISFQDKLPAFMGVYTGTIM